MVEENAKTIQAKQKEYYDRKTKEMDLKAGDKVLLLLPNSTRKFVAKWQGPYTILRRVGKVNFEIEMPDKGRRRQFFMLTTLKNGRSDHIRQMLLSRKEME